MKSVKKIEIRISKEEAEEIVAKHVSQVMQADGYVLSGNVNDLSAWSETLWIGVKNEDG